jgi:hypothetical protein
VFLDSARLNALIAPFRDQLKAYPLYISLDKDVMVSGDAIVNWDSGHLRLGEVQAILAGFLGLANGQLAGMDIVGDWSPVSVKGIFRRILDATEHPPLAIDAVEAAKRNALVTSTLIDRVLGCVGNSPAACAKASA